ncbi:hypothetical protein SLS56_000629 [Neofusicoccum ribis]|uniref:O-methyltransferase n=1 Tax=Neofusicoccum ribis TaxID=45134 RepID=A0ABR3TD31_9PEZI
MADSQSQITAIDQTLRLVSSAGQNYLELIKKDAGHNSRGNAEELSEAKEVLLEQLSQLTRSVAGPFGMVYKHGENTAHTGAVRALYEMGVFNALPEDGESMTAVELAKRLKVDKDLLVRLMRIATALGPFKELGPEEYAHTEYSKIYLKPETRGVFKLLTDEHAIAELKFWEFFRENGWKNPVSATNNPYTFANQTGGKDIWTFMLGHPEKMQNLNDGMGSHSQSSAWTIEIYPFASELSKINTTDDTILFVDIGGGKGHVTRHVRQLCPNIRGKMVFTDTDPVLSSVTETMTGVEKMTYDFFGGKPPVEGALIYYLRRVLHDWPDEATVQILKNVAAGMDASKSRLVICDIVIPLVGANAEACWTDLAMMTFSGTERTVGQFEKLLAAAGLRLDRVYTAHGTNYGAIEARLL